MPEPDSYALWIMPEGAAYALTDGYIARLSAAYDLPRFEPHLTLLSGIIAAIMSIVLRVERSAAISATSRAVTRTLEKMEG